MRERRIATVHRQDGVGHVAPASVRVERDLDLVAVGAEGIFEEGGRADAVLGLATLGGDGDAVRIGRRLALGQRHLAARDRHGLEHESGRRLPQPIADLIVEGDILFLGRDVDVIAQPVEELRPVRLRIDRIEIDILDEDAALRPIGLGVEIHPLARLPAARQPPQRPQIGERIGIDVTRFGKDVRGEAGHAKTFLMDGGKSNSGVGRGALFAFLQCGGEAGALQHLRHAFARGGEHAPQGACLDIAIGAGAVEIDARARKQSERALARPDDPGEADLLGRQREPIAAELAARAIDQALAFQVVEDRLEKLARHPGRLGDIADRDRILMLHSGEMEQRLQRITASLR